MGPKKFEQLPSGTLFSYDESIYYRDLDMQIKDEDQIFVLFSSIPYAKSFGNQDAFDCCKDRQKHDVVATVFVNGGLITFYLCPSHVKVLDHDA